MKKIFLTIIFSFALLFPFSGEIFAQWTEDEPIEPHSWKKKDTIVQQRFLKDDLLYVQVAENPYPYSDFNVCYERFFDKVVSLQIASEIPARWPVNRYSCFFQINYNFLLCSNDFSEWDIKAGFGLNPLFSRFGNETTKKNSWHIATDYLAARFEAGVRYFSGILYEEISYAYLFSHSELRSSTLSYQIRIGLNF